jgi:V8-like Glu-specific endopeptidase
VALSVATAPAHAQSLATLATAKPAAVRSYWTAQRMRAALPVAAAGTEAAAATEVAPKRALHQRVRHITRRPLRAHGKVFFTISPYDFQCSATAVKAPSKSLVISAGHCTYDRSVLSPLGNGIKNWMFVPAYSRGRAPFGKWAGRPTATAEWQASDPTISPTGDILGGDLRFDVGAANVARLHGKTLQSVVGGRPVAFGTSRDHRYVAIGYPAEKPFDGKTEWSCSSPLAGTDASGGAPATIGIACDMTGGSSGGGWVDPRGRLVSLTSYSRSGDDRTLYGPYFGSAIRAFYNSVKSG